ncbi:MAG: IclR family transcriptional regulator [Trebonia sp.]
MRALDRIIDIMDAVAASPQPVPAAVVARQVKLPLPTVSRLMRELAGRRYLQIELQPNTYALGTRLLELGYAARPTNLYDSLVPEMERLRDRTRETVSLHVRSGDQRVCICEIQSQEAVRRVVPVGLTVPLHFGATGIVLLASAPAAFVSKYIEKVNLVATEANTLRERIHLARKVGWAMAEGSWMPGLAGLAALVTTGEDVLSLVVSGPTFRWNREVMERHVGALLDAARRGSVRLSGRVAAGESTPP